MNKRCPECKTVNPPLKWGGNELHDYGHCRAVTGFWFFGLLRKRCNYIVEGWDLHLYFSNWEYCL